MICASHIRPCSDSFFSNMCLCLALFESIRTFGQSALYVFGHWEWNLVQWKDRGKALAQIPWMPVVTLSAGCASSPVP